VRTKLAQLGSDSPAPGKDPGLSHRRGSIAPYRRFGAWVPSGTGFVRGTHISHSGGLTTMVLR